MPQASAGNRITNAAQLNTGVVTSAKILDSEIVNADIAPNAGIDDAKLAEIDDANKVSGASFKSLSLIPAGAGVIPAANLPGSSMSLLKAGNGTAITDNIINLDAIDISGLTALDTLLVIVNVSVVTGASGVVSLRNNTDGIVLMNMRNGASINVGAWEYLQSFIRRAQHSNVIIDCIGDDSTGSGAAPGDNTPLLVNRRIRSNTVTTSWQGSWNLALRMLAGTAGGTIRWSWAVYKMSGQ